MKKKTTSDEEIIKYIDYFVIEFPSKKVTTKTVAEYMQSCGLKIQPYLIRRYEKAYAYLLSKCEERNAFHEANVVVYKELDVKSFLQNNKANLEEALMARDKYYKQISISAAKAFSEVKSEKEMNRQLREKNKALLNKVEQLEKLKVAEEQVKELKAILYDIVYPEVANTILEQRGLLEKETETVKNTHEISVEDFDAETLDILSKLGG